MTNPRLLDMSKHAYAKIVIDTAVGENVRWKTSLISANVTGDQRDGGEKPGKCR